jgi:hypothetical protein
MQPPATDRPGCPRGRGVPQWLLMAFPGSPPRLPHLPPYLPPHHDVATLHQAKQPVSAAANGPIRSATGVHCSALGQLSPLGDAPAVPNSGEVSEIVTRFRRRTCVARANGMDDVPPQLSGSRLSGWKDPWRNLMAAASSCRIRPPTQPRRAGSRRRVVGPPTPTRWPLPVPRLSRPSSPNSPIPQLLRELGGEGARDRVLSLRQDGPVLLGDRRPPAAQCLVYADRL